MTVYRLIAGIAMAVGLVSCTSVKAPEPVYPIPSEHQVEWQKMETYAFIHFGLNTFNDREWGYGDSDPLTFNPACLDAEQWAKTFVASGMKGVIITAKHHDGFCLWPTKYTDYNISATPYKDGKGDIIGELSAACRKYGLKFGVYLSPWDRHQASYGTEDYIKYYRAQLEELTTSYGDLFEMWFDGANGGDGWYGGARETRQIDRRTYYDFPTTNELVYANQPQVIIFSDGGPGCRWVGNEKGIAGETNWSFLRAADVYPGYPHAKELTVGHADGDAWCAAECDVSIRPGWFYHPEEDTEVKTPEYLADLYYKNVGHNGTFLLNFPVDRDGLIHPIDSTNAVNFKKMIDANFAVDLLAGKKAKVSETRGGSFGAKAITDGDYDSYWATSDGVTSGSVEFTFQTSVKMNRLMLQEYIPLGQRVKSFHVEYKESGAWKTLDAGEETTTVGYKRILRFNDIEAEALRICFDDARGPLCINAIKAYLAGSQQ